LFAESFACGFFPRPAGTVCTRAAEFTSLFQIKLVNLAINFGIGNTMIDRKHGADWKRQRSFSI
jgi:hypothetical protein